MSKRMSRVIVSIVCAIGFGVAVPATAGAVTIGIGDQNPAMFSDPRFAALGITTARDVIPWDIVTRRADRGDLAAFRGWLSAAEAANVTPFISFGADYRNPAANYVPSRGAVQDRGEGVPEGVPADQELHRLERAGLLLPQPGPQAGAGRQLLQRAVRDVPPLHRAGRGCVPAGHGTAFIDHSVATLAPWLRAYVKGLHHRPGGWALHDYTEVRGRNTSQLRVLMSMTSGPIWLDETGGVLRRGHWQYHNQSAAAAAQDEQFLLSLSKRFHRIARIYHYQWQANPLAGWDSGLIAADGQPRPAYTVLLNWIKGKHQ